MKRALALVVLLAASAPASAGVDLATAVGRRVTRVEIHNESGVRDSEIETLFLVKPGDVYTPSRVQRSLELLAEKVEIRNVLVRGEEEGDGIALRIEVTPEPVVRSIRFRGNKAVKTSRLASRIGTRVDRPARPAGLARDASAIRELCQAEGFPSAEVEPRVEVLSAGRWVRVVFEVVEGPPRRIARIDIQGDTPLERDQVLAALGLWEGDPASLPKLREGSAQVSELLWRAGYSEARVGKARYEEQAGAVVLVLPVVSGELVDVALEGIDEWTGRPLREIARSRFGETMDKEWANRVAQLMVDYLRGDGYPLAEVHGEPGEAFGQRRVTFSVDRGERGHVEDVAFKGNEAISSKTLRGYMSLVVGGVLWPPPFTPDALESDLRALRGVYASRGYLDAQVNLERQDVSQAEEVRLTLRVEEGPLYHLGEVSFVSQGALSAEEAQAIAGVYGGAPVEPETLDAARLKLLKELQTRGYPDARVVYGEHRGTKPGFLNVIYRVDSGPLVRFGRTVVSGNVRTETHVIRREITFREGEPWNDQEVFRTRQNLYRLGFFQAVRIEGLPTSTDGGVRDAKVEVEEQDAGSVTFGFGYGTEESFKGSLGISHENIQGYGRSLGLRGDFDQIDQSAALNFREPWLFGHKIDLRLSLVHRREQHEAYHLTATGFQASLDRDITENVKGSLQYTLEENRLSQVTDPSAVEEDKLTNYLLSAVGPVLVWDSRDDPFNPKRGFHHTFQAEWALDALGSEVRYERFLGSASGFFTAKGATLALLARAGIITDLGGTAEVPVNKRFFLGGRATVRGFDRDEVGPEGEDGDPIGGDAMLNVKAELRFPLWKQLGGALFWDAGNVWNRADERVKATDLRHGAGPGLRYNTPVGPLSLDVGFKVDRREGEDLVVWHFTAGNVF